jgi:LacI family transcriptional regulator
VPPLRTEIDMGTPMVFLDRAPSGLAADTVVLDNAGGSRAAVAQLVEEGHRRIAILSHSLALDPVKQRYDGALSALYDAGIPLDPALVATDLMNPEAARAEMDRLLDLDDPPTAVFCAYNRITEGVVTSVWERGADTMVAGFDDFRFSRLVPVPLLLVAYDAREYGRTAAERLFARIAGDDSAPRHLTFPTQLVRTGRPLSR